MTRPESSPDPIFPLRRPAWQKPGVFRRRRERCDEARLFLRDLAHQVYANSQHVLACPADVRYSEPEDCGYAQAPLGCGDRAWRRMGEGRDIWCVLDDASQRSLLKFAIGAPGSMQSTAVERSIVDDWIERLLRPACGVIEAARAWEESALRPPASGVWRSDIELSAAGCNATLALFAAREACAPRPSFGSHRRAMDVRVALSGRLTPFHARLGEISKWRAGALVPLEASQSEVRALLHVGDHFVATARLGTSSRRLSLELIEILTASDC